MSRSSASVKVGPASAKPRFVYESFARRRSRALRRIVSWSYASSGRSSTGCQRVSAGTCGSIPAGTSPRYAVASSLAAGFRSGSLSYAARGGVAAAVGEGDDPALHVADTLAAGRGICRPSAVELLCNEAPGRIEWLRELGARFDDGLSLEGGHSRPRVVHAGGAD